MTNGKDPVDRAIGAVADREATVTMCEIPVQIRSTGRPVVLHVPVDLSDHELLELGAFVLVSMRPWILERMGGIQSANLWTPPT